MVNEGFRWKSTVLDSSLDKLETRSNNNEIVILNEWRIWEIDPSAAPQDDKKQKTPDRTSCVRGFLFISRDFGVEGFLKYRIPGNRFAVIRDLDPFASWRIMTDEMTEKCHCEGNTRSNLSRNTDCFACDSQWHVCYCSSERRSRELRTLFLSSPTSHTKDFGDISNFLQSFQ